MQTDIARRWSIVDREILKIYHRWRFGMTEDILGVPHCSIVCFLPGLSNTDRLPESRVLLALSERECSGFNESVSSWQKFLPLYEASRLKESGTNLRWVLFILEAEAPVNSRRRRFGVSVSCLLGSLLWVTKACWSACAGSIRELGFHFKHCLRKSTKASSWHLIAWARDFVDGLLRFPFEEVTVLGFPVASRD